MRLRVFRRLLCLILLRDFLPPTPSRTEKTLQTTAIVVMLCEGHFHALGISFFRATCKGFVAKCRDILFQPLNLCRLRVQGFPLAALLPEHVRAASTQVFGHLVQLLLRLQHLLRGLEEILALPQLPQPCQNVAVSSASVGGHVRSDYDGRLRRSVPFLGLR